MHSHDVNVLQVQMRNRVFDAFDHIFIFSFLKTFKTVCDEKEISESAVMWFIYCYMKKLLHIALSYRFHLKSSKSSKLYMNAGLLLGYGEVVSYLLVRNTADDVISETISDIRSFTKGPGISVIVYSNELWTKMYRCGQVYHEAQLKACLSKAFGRLHIIVCRRIDRAVGRCPCSHCHCTHADIYHQLDVEITFAKDVDRQIQPSRRNREKAHLMLVLQPSYLSSNKNLLESPRRTTTCQASFLVSDIETSSRIHRTKTNSSTIKSDDASFYLLWSFVGPQAAKISIAPECSR